jgi:hypothetical protein
MGRIRGVTKSAQMPLLIIVISIFVKLPADTPSNNPVITYAIRVSTDADETRKIFYYTYEKKWAQLRAHECLQSVFLDII